MQSTTRRTILAFDDSLNFNFLISNADRVIRGLTGGALFLIRLDTGVNPITAAGALITNGRKRRLYFHFSPALVALRMVGFYKNKDGNTANGYRD